MLTPGGNPGDHHDRESALGGRDKPRIVRGLSPVAFATNPARILGLSDRGTLRAKAHADVTLMNPSFEWTLDAGLSKSKSRNTPFDGRSMTGAAVATIVAGRVVFLHPDYSRAALRQGKAAGASHAASVRV